MSEKVLFLDRDGTLIEEPEDGRVDSVEKVRLMPDVLSALLRIQSAGYQLVVLSNQEGLGSDAFPRAAFDRAQQHVQQLFASQGIRFTDVLVCPHLPEDGCPCRKPGLGLLWDFLAEHSIDRDRSAVVGDRDSDMIMAKHLGVRGFKVALNGAREESWPHIARALLERPRAAVVERRTRETEVRVEVDLDERADPDISTGIGFFDHMLEQLAKHGGFRLTLRCRGDLHIDEHHTVEDVALTLGQALREALGDKRGIARYGFLLPMDEAQAQVALDLGGRPYLRFEGTFPRERVGELPTELVPHFFRSLTETLGAAIHVRVEGDNSHHMVEACFKSVARALRSAIARSGDDLPSTKGLL